jgi:DNA-binding phage protein
MNAAVASYEEGLHQALREPAEAAAYLDAALEEGDLQSFLVALRDVAEARGMSNAARAANLNRDDVNAHGADVAVR